MRRGPYQGLLFTAGDHRHSWTVMTPSLPPLLGSENGTEKKELCSHPTGAVYALDMNQVRRVIASASGGSATHVEQRLW